jgi:tripartite ATP-independent transporter DctP family solute receptor
MLFAAGACLLPGAAPLATATRVLTAADSQVNGYPTVAAVQWIGRRLAEETGGRLGIRSYHSGQLGREGDTVEMARFGAIDLARVNFAALNNAFPLTQAFVLPYVFESLAHMRRAVDGAAGRAVLDGFAARKLVGLCTYDAGTRSVYNVRRPLHRPADLAGLKIRVPPSDVFIELGRALGANPTPLPFGEVYTALETHLIDGAENNVRAFHATRQFEVARFWSRTAHSYSPDALVLSRRTFDSLAPRDRELLLALAAESVPYMRTLWDRAEADSLAAVTVAGVAFNDVDLDAFRQATAPVVERRIREPALRRVYDQIRSVA